MTAWYEKELICPIDRLHLQLQDNFLICPKGCRYPVVNDVPVVLIEDSPQTIGVAYNSIKRAKIDKDIADKKEPDYYLKTLGISEEEKKQIIKLRNSKNTKIDPVIAYLIGATCGNSYKHLIGKLQKYPIPNIPLPAAKNKDNLLDLGCGWGRWCISAARLGYTVTGIDPSLGAVMAAKRLANKMNLPIRYLVADARFLPFEDKCFDLVFSYSCLQHLSKENVKNAVFNISRVLKENKKCLIQMPNRLGIRNLQNQLKRKFKKPQGFEVRYWAISELKKCFQKNIGNTKIIVDCYFGLGLQRSDFEYMPLKIKFLILASSFLKKLSCFFSPLKHLADSVFIESTKRVSQS